MQQFVVLGSWVVGSRFGAKFKSGWVSDLSTVNFILFTLLVRIALPLSKNRSDGIKEPALSDGVRSGRRLLRSMRRRVRNSSLGLG